MLKAFKRFMIFVESLSETFFTLLLILHVTFDKEPSNNTGDAEINLATMAILFEIRRRFLKSAAYTLMSGANIYA